jgi:hypothetical protein
VSVTLPDEPGRECDADFSLTNPSTKPVHWELVFGAGAGSGRCTCLVGGTLVATGLVAAAGEERLSDITVRPDERLDLSVHLLVQPGVTYPATLILRPFTEGWRGRGPYPPSPKRP